MNYSSSQISDMFNTCSFFVKGHEIKHNWAPSSFPSQPHYTFHTSTHSLYLSCFASTPPPHPEFLYCLLQILPPDQKVSILFYFPSSQCHILMSRSHSLSVCHICLVPNISSHSPTACPVPNHLVWNVTQLIQLRATNIHSFSTQNLHVCFFHLLDHFSSS